MKISDLACNAAINAICALLDANPPGVLKIYTGSAPTNTTDADSGTLLSTLTFSNTSFGAASSKTATANTITSDTNVANTGTAGYFRAKDGNGVTIMQGTVGTSGTDLIFNTVNFVAGGTCAITSLTATQPNT